MRIETSFGNKDTNKEGSGSPHLSTEIDSVYFIIVMTTNDFEDPFQAKN